MNKSKYLLVISLTTSCNGMILESSHQIRRVIVYSTSTLKIIMNMKNPFRKVQLQSQSQGSTIKNQYLFQMMITTIIMRMSYLKVQPESHLFQQDHQGSFHFLRDQLAVQIKQQRVIPVPGH